jgi:hypothetical protein
MEIFSLFLLPKLPPEPDAVWEKIYLPALNLASKRTKNVIVLGDVQNVRSLNRNRMCKVFPLAQARFLPPPYKRNRIVELAESLSKNSIVIACSNLCEYSKTKTPGFLSFPQQLSRMKLEDGLLCAMNGRVEIDSVREALTLEPRIVSNSEALMAVVKIAAHLGYHGYVHQYIDSNTLERSGIDRYVIQPKPIEQLTSYVAMAFNIRGPPIGISELDIDMALACIRSLLLRNVARKKYKIRLPKFHRFHNMKNGVFVRTGMQRGIRFVPNCSSGAMETEENTTADTFMHSLEQCECNSISKWRKPHDRYSAYDYILRFELIESKSSWRRVPGHRALDLVELDGQVGMRLVLENGNTATFLPNESRLFWNKNQLIARLLDKAGGTASDILFAECQIFRSISFTH